jgi:hypothetical protein
VCYNKPLVVLDACNIPLDMEKCRSILDNTIGHIVYLHITLESSVNVGDFREQIIACYLDTSISVYKP